MQRRTRAGWAGALLLALAAVARASDTAGAWNNSPPAPSPAPSPSPSPTPSPAPSPAADTTTNEPQLIAEFGMAGNGTIPFSAQEAQEQGRDLQILENAVYDCIGVHVQFGLKNVTNYSDWYSMPQDLQDLARQEWNNPPVSTRDSPNNTSRAASGNNSTRRMLVHRRLAGRALLDGGNMTGASSDSVPVGVSGVKITVTITITEPLVDIVALTANLTASAQCLRAKQLSTYGAGTNMAIGVLSTSSLGTGRQNSKATLAAVNDGGAEQASAPSPAPVIIVPPPPKAGLSAGAAAGIAVASVTAVALLGVGIWKRRRVLALLRRGAVHDTPLPPPPDGESLLRPDQAAILQRPDGTDWLLGEGAMGSVYRGTLHGKLPVAIKVLRGSAVNQEVNQEVALLKACRNSNIVQFQGVVIRKDSIWLVQELCESDLYTAIGNGKVSWYKRGRKIAVDVARGLHFLHSNKIVHLDLKSPNVLLTQAGTAKICDVGLSRILTNTHITQANLGTFAWCAPEVLLAQRATAAADIFSFGVLLWEIITGLRPARGQLREVVAPEECPQAVKELLDSCLSSDPAQRPTAAQIIEVLTRGLGRGNSSQTDLAAAGVVPPPAVPADPSSGINSTTLLLPKGGGSSGQDGVLGKGGLQQDVLAYAGSASTGSGLIPAESADGSGRPASEWIELGPATPPPPGQQPAGEQQPVPPPAQEGQQPQGQQPLQEQAEQAGSGETFDEAHARLLAAAWQAAQQAFGGESDHPC